ncbi:MAG: AbrB/MazE/SpoVT family DNA-binding domain-containing protein [Chloroflexota bacterium]|nr:AbrB/MazE/SpoVT family DNA-binding domain-containing protein [Chloroflexota bacterium]
MQTRIRKWGNSLAIRIPRVFALEAELEQDALVELSLEEGKVTIVPVSELPLSLDDLLSRITEDNLHGEVDTGQAAGREVW